MSVGRVQRGRAAVAEPSIAMPERCGIRDCAGKRDIQHAPRAADRSSVFGLEVGTGVARCPCRVAGSETARVGWPWTERCSSDMYTCCWTPRTHTPQ